MKLKNKYLKLFSFPDLSTVYIAGDLFEKEEDLQDPEIWKSAGSDNPELQIKNRNRVLREANFIVPGHGPMFKVTPAHRQNLY